MINKNMYKEHEKMNKLARAKAAYEKQKRREAAEHYRKMIGRDKKEDDK